MSVSLDLVNADLDLCLDLKSPSSQESGLGTMVVMEDSLGSLEELSDGIHLQLNTHMNHSRLLQFELDLLRAQLAEKNSLISSQQISIKQLQDALNASQRDTNDFKRITETELTCKNETISILQSDLADCQQQYAESFHQVVDQDRLLSELRDQNAVLIQKIRFLESQLRKSTRDAVTQTSPALTASHHHFQPAYGQRMIDPSDSYPQMSTLRRPTDRHPRRSVPSTADSLVISSRCISPVPIELSPPPELSANSLEKFVTSEMFQELLEEIRLLRQQKSQSMGVAPPPPPVQHYQPHQQTSCEHRCNPKNESMAEIWNVITEEKQHRLQLEHSLRLMEIDLMDARNQVQNCSARISLQNVQFQGQVCASNNERCCVSNLATTAKCYQCTATAATSLFTLV